MALGATGRHVIRLVVREGLALAGAGLAAGLALAALANGMIQSWVLGTSRLDVAVVTGAALVLAAATLLASWLPARRATRIEPTWALRRE